MRQCQSSNQTEGEEEESVIIIKGVGGLMGDWGDRTGVPPWNKHGFLEGNGTQHTPWSYHIVVVGTLLAVYG